jgi:hypothetical protein
LKSLSEIERIAERLGMFYLSIHDLAVYLAAGMNDTRVKRYVGESIENVAEYENTIIVATEYEKGIEILVENYRCIKILPLSRKLRKLNSDMEINNIDELGRKLGIK